MPSSIHTILDEHVARTPGLSWEWVPGEDRIQIDFRPDERQPWHLHRVTISGLALSKTPYKDELIQRHVRLLTRAALA